MIEGVNIKSSCKLCGKSRDLWREVLPGNGEFVCNSCLTKPKEREERVKEREERVAVIQQLMKEIPPDKIRTQYYYEQQSSATLRIWLKMEQAKKGHSPMLQESFKCSQQASEAIKAMQNILVLSLGRVTVSNKQKDAVTDIKIEKGYEKKDLKGKIRVLSSQEGQTCEKCGKLAPFLFPHCGLWLCSQCFVCFVADPLSIEKGYEKKDLKGIIEYFEHVLSSSDYPSDFPRTFQIDYNPETSMLIVNYSLPNINVMPKIKEVKYVKSKNDLLEVPLAESTVNELYDSVVYQITLRTLHELFESDVYNMIEAIILNGWVESIDTATGKNVNRCIISIQTNRQEFSQIDLARVDPKACFKKLKGIGSSALHSWTAIAPIVIINREDKRFVQAYEVAKDLEESFNLAGMPWEDFEHLVRELFDKEFSQDGGGVNITRTSRDGGIDAIAFDPDPIRGGKIAIQAKCYTNTVGVDAVRDLYGTVINEGANKGILVTTSDYGADAYEFAKGKPLTLMNGSNLLYLLEKHGYKAKIDLKAAKQTKSNRESTKQ